MVEHVNRSQEGRGVTGNSSPVHLLSHRVRVLSNGARAAIVWALVTIGLLTGSVHNDPSPAAAQTVTPVASPSARTGPTPNNAPGPLQVTVGLYLVEVHGLDQEESTYHADFYLWMRWHGEPDPTPTVELFNNVARWSLTMRQIFPEPVVLPSGERLQQFHVEGAFFEPLVLQDYPLDTHALTVKIEDSTWSRDQLVYVPDTEQSNISPEVRLPGWSITGWDLAEHGFQYETDYGDTSAAAPEFSRFEFALRIERPDSFFRWKLLLPLLIVLLLGCSVLVVHPTYAEVRLAGPATALLTLVFLQQGYSETLPETGGLVLLDKIYVLAFAVVLGLIGVTILTSHWMREGAEQAVRAQRLDRVAAVGLFAMFLVGTLILLIPVL
jgi:hypothetical protein